MVVKRLSKACGVTGLVSFAAGLLLSTLRNVNDRRKIKLVVKRTKKRYYPVLFRWLNSRERSKGPPVSLSVTVGRLLFLGKRG